MNEELNNEKNVEKELLKDTEAEKKKKFEQLYQ